MKHILWIDDDRHRFNDIEYNFFKNINASIENSMTIEDAILKMELVKYDIIILDLILPIPDESFINSRFKNISKEFLLMENCRQFCGITFIELIRNGKLRNIVRDNIPIIIYSVEPEFSNHIDDPNTYHICKSTFYYDNPLLDVIKELV